MKKVIVLGIVVLALSGCGSTGGTSDSTKNEKNEVTTSQTNSTSNQDKDNLKSVAKELEDKFNTDGEKLVKVETTNDVTDSTSDKPHSVIEVRVIDDEARKNMQEMKNAVDSNTATEEQLTAIYGIQLNIEEAAKKLKNENDIVQFVNPDTNGNNVVIALANKTENIIPLVK